MSPGKNQAEKIAFGAFHLDPADERLISSTGPIKLGNKAYQLLLRLVEEEGRLVTKDALFSSVWDGTIVSESALTSTVKELRRALGDESRTPQYIESVYGRGYRLIPEVVRLGGVAELQGLAVGEQESPSRRPTLPLVKTGRRQPLLSGLAVAVLPFERSGDASDKARLAEWIAEELIELITQMRWIPVIPKADSCVWSRETATPQEVGARLGARYLVEGKLQHAADRISVTATLSCAGSGRMLCSRRVNLPKTAKPGELRPSLLELAGALSGQIEDQEMRRAIALADDDLELSDLIWRARWHSGQYTREGNRAAEALLQETLNEAPHSTEAVIHLAFCRMRDVWYQRGGASQLRELRRLAQRAIVADEWDGRGYMIAGIAELLMRQSAAAQALLEQAVHLNPCLGFAHSQLGTVQYMRGRPDLAIESFKEAFRLGVGEHNEYFVSGELAMARAMLSQWDSAIEAAELSIMRRMGYWYAHVAKIHALVSRQDLAAAAEARAQLEAAKPSFCAELIDWLPFVDRAWPEQLKHSLELARHGEA